MTGKKWFTYLLILVVIMLIMWVLEMVIPSINEADLPFGIDADDPLGSLKITF